MCDECIDAVKENPFTGDGARFVNIESVLKSLDKRVTELEREATSPQPQPRTPRLVEADMSVLSQRSLLMDIVYARVLACIGAGIGSPSFPERWGDVIASVQRLQQMDKPKESL